MGGSFGYEDADVGIGFAYVTNRMGFNVWTTREISHCVPRSNNAFGRRLGRQTRNRRFLFERPVDRRDAII